jgi:hypothetical protein
MNQQLVPLIISTASRRENITSRPIPSLVCSKEHSPYTPDKQPSCQAFFLPFDILGGRCRTGIAIKASLLAVDPCIPGAFLDNPSFPLCIGSSRTKQRGDLLCEVA